MNSDLAIARALAMDFVAGTMAPDDLLDRGATLLGTRPRWLHRLCQRVAAKFHGRTRPRMLTVVAFLLADRGFQRACDKYDLELVGRRVRQSEMCPIPAAALWSIPALRTPRELAEWLAVPLHELDWFADRRRWAYTQPANRLNHYWYRPLWKRWGRIRLIEAPKPRLKEMQRQILTGILNAIPVHTAVHGFLRGKSIQTFAAPHVGETVVVRIDLRDFFPSIRSAQIEALFRAVGYPESVADLLTGLCTNSTPSAVWDNIPIPLEGPQRNIGYRYSQPHLPQGAPTSPVLANLCAYRLDCRLDQLAKSAGAVYTRYADDLAFSGGRDFARSAQRFCVHVAATAAEQGFDVCYRKTRVMHQSVRQQLAGIVVNQQLNVRRQDYDRLKATLVNCIRHGAATQNRDGNDDFRAYLLGKISFVAMINPHRGQRLRTLFERIKW